MNCNRITVSTRLTNYIPIPHDLLQTDLSSTALLLYGLLLDRSSLSRKNDYTDFGGWVYVVYAREDLARELHISTRMVTKYLQDLENRGLIRRIRRSRKEGNRYFLSVPAESDKGSGTGTDTGSFLPQEGKNSSLRTGSKVPPNHRKEPPDLTALYHCNEEESL